MCEQKPPLPFAAACHVVLVDPRLGSLPIGARMRQDATVGMAQKIIPEPVADDDDDIVVALETARVSEERRDVESALRWLERAVHAARRQGRTERAGALTKSILRLGGTEPSFETSKAVTGVLSEISDEDFSEQTIVESSFDIDNKQAAEVLVPNSTPAAPLSVPDRVPYHLTTRVAVRKVLGGRFEVRALSEGERLQSGEQEALLVPLASDVRF